MSALLLLRLSAALQELSAQFEVPAEMRVDLWAESPLLYNPSAIDIDAAGRVWVAEAVNYRQWSGRNPGRHHEAGDRIVVLEDADGDGAAERSTVFAQDPELTAPLGVAVIGERVYVSCSPSLFVYEDRDGDLRADRRETLLTGFGGFDHDHGLHSVIAAPDGGLFWCAGNAGPHQVTDRAGWRLRSGSVYNDGGPGDPGNRPGLVSDDGRVWTGGLIGRLRPDGTGMEVLAHNFRNQYEAAVDAFGVLYTADNDDDGNGGCRTVAVLEGGNYGFFSADGARFWQADRRPGQDRVAAHWHQDDPGVMPMGCDNGTGGPTGLAVYEGPLWPELLGCVLDADAGRSLVYTHQPQIEGAALALRHGVLIQPRAAAGGERARWFRPSDVAVAPDGTILIADWYDPGVGGHAAGDGAAYGRLLRLRPAQYDGWGPLDAGIDSPAVNVRGTAIARGIVPEDAPADPRALARRLWLWARDPQTRTRVEAALAHPDPHLRLCAYRALTQALGADGARALAMAGDAAPYVRAGVAVSLRRLDWEQSRDALLALCSGYSSAPDRTLLEAIGTGAQGKEAELFAALSDPPFDLSWRLHPPAALAALRAAASGPDPARARRALDALGLMPAREAAEAMVALALAGPPERRDHAAWWVRHNGAHRWLAYGVAEAVAGDFSRAERVWESPVLGPESGRIAVDVALAGAEVLWLVVEDAGDGNGYDWADWIAPRFVDDEDEETALSGLPWLEASAQWGSVQRQANAGGGPLLVRGAAIADGIGTHAASLIGFRVPADATRFLAECAPDDGGARQSGTITSLRFALYLERPLDRSAVNTLRLRAQSGDTRAALALAEDVEGALFLLDRTGMLSGEVLDAIAPRLRQHADFSVRALASAVFPRQSAGGAALPPLDELARLEGRSARGRELFRGRPGCITCHAFDGMGGTTGPDLSGIRLKYGRRELLDAMLNPSAGIAFGYEAWTVELRDGRILLGTILGDGDTLVLRDSSGRPQALPAADVVKRRTESVSTMPEAASLVQDAQELADIVAFLLEDPAAPPRFGPEITLFNGRDLTGWNVFPADGSEGTWSVHEGLLRCSGTPAGYLYTMEAFCNFELELEWRFVQAGNSGVLLRVQSPHQVWPRSIEAQLNAGDAGDLWNIGEFPLAADPGRTGGRRTVKLAPASERPRGDWNQYRIRLDHGRLSLEVNGVHQNTAAWCAELPGPIALQAEGAMLEFRALRLRPILD